jgi:hypothetical protein
MGWPLSLDSIAYESLVEIAGRCAAGGRSAHLHTTPPGCLITGSALRAIVLEIDGDAPRAYFSDTPIEALAKPLAVLLHGADSVPDDTEVLDPVSAAVERMAERMRGGFGHFHILGPACGVNPHTRRWTILFEDRELGVLEQVTDDRPLADIRLIERLIYAWSPLS